MDRYCPGSVLTCQTSQIPPTVKFINFLFSFPTDITVFLLQTMASALSPELAQCCYGLCKQCWMASHRKGGLDAALMKATESGHLQCVDILLKVGADVNKPDLENYTPLLKASQNSHHQCIEALLKAGAFVNRHGVNNLMALCLALDHIQCVEKLIKVGADVNQQATMSGWTPLIWALNAGNDLHMSANMLLKNGADINKGDYYHGSTPLMHVVQNKENDIAYILEAGADVNRTDKYN